MAKSSAWGIKQGLIFAITSVLGIFIVSEVAPRPELKPILYSLAGICAVGGIGSGIKYELANGDNSRPVVRRRNPNFLSGPESPETAIARRIPNSMKRALNRDNKRSNYIQGLEVGARVTKEYLGNLSREEYSRIKKIKIYPEQQRRFLGIPLGRRSLEVRVKK